MTTANKEIARRYIEALNQHDVDGAAALAQADIVNHAAIPRHRARRGSAGSWARCSRRSPTRAGCSKT